MKGTAFLRRPRELPDDDAAESAKRFRVDGVPFFIVNGTLTLSGAEQSDAFLDAFSQAIGST